MLMRQNSCPQELGDGVGPGLGCDQGEQLKPICFPLIESPASEPIAMAGSGEVAVEATSAKGRKQSWRWWWRLCGPPIPFSQQVPLDLFSS